MNRGVRQGARVQEELERHLRAPTPGRRAKSERELMSMLATGGRAEREHRAGIIHGASLPRQGSLGAFGQELVRALRQSNVESKAVRRLFDLRELGENPGEIPAVSHEGP